MSDSYSHTIRCEQRVDFDSCQMEKKYEYPATVTTVRFFAKARRRASAFVRQAAQLNISCKATGSFTFPVRSLFLLLHMKAVLLLLIRVLTDDSDCIALVPEQLQIHTDEEVRRTTTSTTFYATAIRLSKANRAFYEPVASQFGGSSSSSHWEHRPGEGEDKPRVTRTRGDADAAAGGLRLPCIILPSPSLQERGGRTAPTTKSSVSVPPRCEEADGASAGASVPVRSRAYNSDPFPASQL
ncbi:unnamed protein product [Amoebophrya sp. A120]|nr:unnamed protein product [Amoebophrya sp. A120]|eukprot:GSA120T00024342001.1